MRGVEESIRVHHPPLNCLHYLQAAVLFPLPFPRNLPLDEGRAFLLVSERESLPLAAGVGFAVGFFVDFFLDFFVDFNFGFNLGVVVAAGFMFVFVGAMAVPLVTFLVLLPSPCTFFACASFASRDWIRPLSSSIDVSTFLNQPLESGATC
jgi:hypothetical protein